MIDASKLTDEQVKIAAAAYSKAYDEQLPNVAWIKKHNIALRAAAPYLQIPWDEIKDWEFANFWDTINSSGSPFRLRSNLNNFVEKRNIALLPPPPDPRREALVKAFEEAKDKFDSDFVWSESLADIALKALDGIKP